MKGRAEEALGEAEHVGALGTAALLRLQLNVGVDLALEPRQELLGGGTGASGSVVGAAPRDLSRDPLLMSLAAMRRRRPRLLRGVIVSAFCLSGCIRAFTCRHARETADETIRETVTHREAPWW